MSQLSTAARRKHILDYIKNNGATDVSYFSAALNVSEMTIRRDLMKLEEEKKLLRIHGGAVSMPGSSFEFPLNNRLYINREEKNAIGQFAAGLIEEGDVIAMDASTTALAMAGHLAVKATVITNNMEIAVRLLGNPLAEVIVLGGHLRKSSVSTVGFEMVHMMRGYRVDKLFFSSKAASAAYGISDATVEEGEAKKAMIEAAQWRYLMLDHTKLDTNAFYKVCDLDGRCEMITDKFDHYTDGQRNFLRHCKENGISVHFV